MSARTNRRNFLKTAAVTGAGLWAAARSDNARGDTVPANEKINVAFIGVGGRGRDNVESIAANPGVNVVALCDADENRARAAFDKYPGAAKYRDYREMLDKQAKTIDAVVVSTPDHQHAPASMRAIKLGKHVYCEKPLTHTIQEARALAKAAIEHKVATQMGNQGSAEPTLREAVEIVQSGAIGNVTEVHAWTNRPGWPQGAAAILGHSGVQMALRGKARDHDKNSRLTDDIAWDLWLGPASERPFNRAYLPFLWRGWQDFGTGALGDMACHSTNMAFRACKLAGPTSIEAEASEVNGETFPLWSVIRYEFPARGDLPPLKWTWYDGGAAMPAWAAKKLSDLAQGRELAKSGSILVGEKGTLLSPHDYGVHAVLLPEDRYRGYKAPTPTIPRSPGHHKEWLQAIKGGTAGYSNFPEHGAPLTEVVLLGNIATRFVGRKLEWDAANAKFTNVPEANRFLTKEYRKGWEL